MPDLKVTFPSYWKRVLVSVLVGNILIAVGAYLIGVESVGQHDCSLEIGNRTHGITFPMTECESLQKACVLMDPDYPPCILNMPGGCHSGVVPMECHWTGATSSCSCRVAP